MYFLIGESANKIVCTFAFCLVTQFMTTRIASIINFFCLYLCANSFFIPSVAFAQKLSTTKLIEVFKSDDVYQTKKNAALYGDLLTNFCEQTFNRLY